MTYYHTDHLGSSSWITYTDGSPVQYMSYMPFGESQIDQRTGDWNSRYTFSGKERDEETGYSYFGARYYDPDISIWLSRDPLADKRPWESPYSYCGNNPIRRVDPTGMIWEDPEGIVSGYKSKVTERRDYYANKNTALLNKRDARISEGKGTKSIDRQYRETNLTRILIKVY